jgi:hypothetical protein
VLGITPVDITYRWRPWVTWVTVRDAGLDWIDPDTGLDYIATRQTVSLSNSVAFERRPSFLRIRNKPVGEGYRGLRVDSRRQLRRWVGRLINSDDCWTCG